ncbi:MAG: hypothetical protein OMM_10412 [Candidatus Magnetoglobus multicellularis str. Araruama]|uniref:Glycoside-hydrolase family GH114 TIM-barrel domain-containing protein n=1 Tax=Candidatus Magnetoglobus multicellularis str. Araruama TaxID=890399 RepID=A0A1V1P1A9_9BACT|nr:MAG: hypothetical protein OMM_10412 [Candidatus Magnetoglobus multicellularis str. Araruama]
MEKNWKPGNPSFLDKENENWTGNYKVKYWDKSWWEVAIRPYLNRIIAAGFDGIYLDIIDAYYYWSQKDYPVQECANKMIDLVLKIRSYMKKQGLGNVTICPQNALGIVFDASLIAKKNI